jgi:hypothetical protein
VDAEGGQSGKNRKSSNEAKVEMRPGTSSRRSRGRGNRKPHVPSKNQTFDSNGPEVRVRGNAHQVLEKYLALARDAQAAGDRIAAENYFQHAEHYFRIINANGEGNGRPRQNHRPEGDGQPQPAVAPVGSPQPVTNGSGGDALPGIALDDEDEVDPGSSPTELI